MPIFGKRFGYCRQLASIPSLDYAAVMKRWLLACVCLIQFLGFNAPAAESGLKHVYILPIRDDIMPPMVYLVRRGVKDAMDAKADALILDMDTNGGRVDTTEEIIEIL